MSANVADLIAAIEGLTPAARAAIESLTDEQAIRAAAAGFVGKKGKLPALMREMGALPAADRPRVGEVANRIKLEVEGAIESKLRELADAELERDLARRMDLTLPGRPIMMGRLHLLTQVRLESQAIFAELGFAVAEGPQVESDFHNFEALAMPADHPARDAQDTFYVEARAGVGAVLRTHTSPVQIRTMLTQKPPIRIVAPGQVYRRDDDPTHSPMFTQIEGLAVDEDISLGDLKGVLTHYVSRFFGQSLRVRLRPSYFPFVEPGCEVDMQCRFCESGCRLCKGTGWIEIGGAGMVDPDVFAHVHIDAERYTGFAFGMGLERMAMLRHQVNDIKYYYEGDLRFLEQF